jgi:hypothetical protein
MEGRGSCLGGCRWLRANWNGEGGGGGGGGGGGMRAISTMMQLMLF